MVLLNKKQIDFIIDDLDLQEDYYGSQIDDFKNNKSFIAHDFVDNDFPYTIYSVRKTGEPVLLECITESFFNRIMKIGD